MNRVLLMFVFAIYCSIAYSQVVDGDLKRDRRAVANDFQFELVDVEAGEIVFRIAVNHKGEVTGAQLVDDKSTPVSTPTYVRAKNHVMKLKFVEGTYFPKFHHGEVKITIKNGN